MRLNNYTTLYNEFILKKKVSCSCCCKCFFYTPPTDFERYAGKEYKWFQWDRWRPYVSRLCDGERTDELRDIDDALARLDSSCLNPTNYSEDTIYQLDELINLSEKALSNHTLHCNPILINAIENLKTWAKRKKDPLEDERIKIREKSFKQEEMSKDIAKTHSDNQENEKKKLTTAIKDVLKNHNYLQTITNGNTAMTALLETAKNPKLTPPTPTLKGMLFFLGKLKQLTKRLDPNNTYVLSCGVAKIEGSGSESCVRMILADDPTLKPLYELCRDITKPDSYMIEKHKKATLRRHANDALQNTPKESYLELRDYYLRDKDPQLNTLVEFSDTKDKKERFKDILQNVLNTVAEISPFRAYYLKHRFEKFLKDDEDLRKQQQYKFTELYPGKDPISVADTKTFDYVKKTAEVLAEHVKCGNGRLSRDLSAITKEDGRIIDFSLLDPKTFAELVIPKFTHETPQSPITLKGIDFIREIAQRNPSLIKSLIETSEGPNFGEKNEAIKDQLQTEYHSLIQYAEPSWPKFSSDQITDEPMYGELPLGIGQDNLYKAFLLTFMNIQLEKPIIWSERDRHIDRKKYRAAATALLNELTLFKDHRNINKWKEILKKIFNNGRGRDNQINQFIIYFLEKFRESVELIEAFGFCCEKCKGEEDKGIEFPDKPNFVGTGSTSLKEKVTNPPSVSDPSIITSLPDHMFTQEIRANQYNAWQSDIATALSTVVDKYIPATDGYLPQSKREKKETIKNNIESWMLDTLCSEVSDIDRLARIATYIMNHIDHLEYWQENQELKSEIDLLQKTLGEVYENICIEFSKKHSAMPIKKKRKLFNKLSGRLGENLPPPTNYEEGLEEKKENELDEVDEIDKVGITTLRLSKRPYANPQVDGISVTDPIQQLKETTENRTVFSIVGDFGSGKTTVTEKLKDHHDVSILANIETAASTNDLGRNASNSGLFTSTEKVKLQLAEIIGSPLQILSTNDEEVEGATVGCACCAARDKLTAVIKSFDSKAGNKSIKIIDSAGMVDPNGLFNIAIETPFGRTKFTQSIVIINSESEGDKFLLELAAERGMTKDKIKAKIEANKKRPGYEFLEIKFDALCHATHVIHNPHFSHGKDRSASNLHIEEKIRTLCSLANKENTDYMLPHVYVNQDVRNQDQLNAITQSLIDLRKAHILKRKLKEAVYQSLIDTKVLVEDASGTVHLTIPIKEIQSHAEVPEEAKPILHEAFNAINRDAIEEDNDIDESEVPDEFTQYHIDLSLSKDQQIELFNLLNKPEIGLYRAKGFQIFNDELYEFQLESNKHVHFYKIEDGEKQPVTWNGSDFVLQPHL